MKKDKRMKNWPQWLGIETTDLLFSGQASLYIYLKNIERHPGVVPSWEGAVHRGGAVYKGVRREQCTWGKGAGSTDHPCHPLL